MESPKCGKLLPLHTEEARAMAKKTEPLSGIDAAWLGMEDPTNLMMVTGILTFSKPVDFDRLKLVIERRWLRFDRFRQRVVQPKTPWATKAWFPPYWETDPHFDIDNHLGRIQLPPPGDRAALREAVSQLMSTPLDFSRPLWQMHLIEGVAGGSVLLNRVHHCIADGMGLTHCLLSITDKRPDAPLPEEWAEEEDFDDVGLRGGLFEALFKQAASVAGAFTRMTGKVLHESLETLGNPGHILELAKYGADNAMALQRLFLRPDDPPTLFRGKLGVAKRAAWSRPLPLADVKAIKTFTGGTVNDVLITAMTGGLRQYLVERNALPRRLNFRAAIPVDLRSPEELGELGNKFGLVFLSLPVSVEDPLERLAVVRRRMDELKSSQEAPVLFGLMSAAGMLAHEIQRILVEMLGAKGTAVMTNMKGPGRALYLAGEKVDHMMFWVPQSGRMGLGVSILSYDDKVYLGVATDAGLVPDPERIVEGFNREFEFLLKTAREGGVEPRTASAPKESEPEAAPTEAGSTAAPARKPVARKPVARRPGAAPAPAPAVKEAVAPPPAASGRKPVARKPIARKAGIAAVDRPSAVPAPPEPTASSAVARKPLARKPILKKPGAAAPAPAKPAPVPVRCRATTKAGRPCRNQPLADSEYCAVHRPG